MKQCITCGMPMENAADFGMQDVQFETCIHCTNLDGSVKSCQEIFEGGVQFFMQTMEADRTKAEQLVRKNMLQLPYWKCLSGPIATDDEFQEAMGKLG